jgi:hypothetical protein
MIRSASTHVLALGLALTLVDFAAARPAAAAHHEPVIQVFTVEVAPGQLERYRQEIKKLTAVLARLASSGKMRMWQATAAGPDTGAVLVGIEYPNAAAWAADSTKIQGDAEWQKILAGLDELRTLEGSSIWRDVSQSPGQASAPSSGVLLITGVQVKPGKLDTYRQRLASGQAISERLGLKARMRAWHAELAGPTTGAVAVGVEYPDLATYVADQAKLAGDPEWQKLVSGLDEIRTLGGRSLYQEITP